MFTFYKEYPEFLILPMPVAKLETDTISPTPSAELEDTSILQLPVAKSKSKIGQLPVAQLENTEYQQYLIRNTGWAQHSVLIQKVKDLPTRYWYMQQTISNSWSYDILVEMIKSNLYMRQGAIVNNFDQTLPNLNFDLAKQLGISEYELTRALPDNFKDSLPSVEEIEKAVV